MTKHTQKVKQIEVVKNDNKYGVILPKNNKKFKNSKIDINKKVSLFFLIMGIIGIVGIIIHVIMILGTKRYCEIHEMIEMDFKMKKTLPFISLIIPIMFIFSISLTFFSKYKKILKKQKNNIIEKYDFELNEENWKDELVVWVNQNEKIRDDKKQEIYNIIAWRVQIIELESLQNDEQNIEVVEKQKQLADNIECLVEEIKLQYAKRKPLNNACKKIERKIKNQRNLLKEINNRKLHESKISGWEFDEFEIMI